MPSSFLCGLSVYESPVMFAVSVGGRGTGGEGICYTKMSHKNVARLTRCNEARNSFGRTFEEKEGFDIR